MSAAGRYSVSVAIPSSSAAIHTRLAELRRIAQNLRQADAGLVRLAALPSISHDFLPQVLQPTPTPGILARMLANLLRIYLDRGEHHRALAAVDLLLVLTPDAAEHVRMRGLLHERLECIDAARDDFRRYLELAPDAPHAGETRDRLARLGRTRITLH